MSEISGRFRQAPSENRRYLIDYTLELQPGEIITNVQIGGITSPTGDSPPALVVNNVSISATGLQAFFYASAGLDQQDYEVEFLATTSLNQTFEDVVAFSIREKV